MLRGAGIASELYLGAAGMNAQLKYADRRRSLCAVIQGSNERDAPGGPQVVVRDLALGAELAKASKDRSDYLEMRQRAQIAAPEAELVTRVREVLARGGAPLLGAVRAVAAIVGAVADRASLRRRELSRTRRFAPDAVGDRVYSAGPA